MRESEQKMNSKITTSTKVTFPNSPDIFSISRICYEEPTGAVESLDILRRGFGHVFSGTIEQAEAEGWIFHVENEVTMEEINTLLGPDLEPQPLPLSDLPEKIAMLEGRLEEKQGVIDNLQHELSRANERVEKFRQQVQDVINGRNETLRQWAVEKVAKGNVTRAVANELLDQFAIDNVPGKYTGDAIFLDGSRIEGIVFEADDEGDWKGKVRDALEVGAVRVKYEVTIRDDEASHSVKVDEYDSYYAPDEEDSWVYFESIEEVQ